MIEGIQTRKDTEATLQEQRTAFSGAIFDHATVAMYLVEPDDGSIQDANRRVPQLPRAAPRAYPSG